MTDNDDADRSARVTEVAEPQPAPIPADAAGQPVAVLPARVRASDAERETVVARLHAALGEGRMDLAETDQRLGTVYTCRYRDELAALTADLPPAGTGERQTWTDVWRVLVGQMWRSWARMAGAPLEPTAKQRSRAAVLTVLGAVWMICCLLAGLVAGVS